MWQSLKTDPLRQELVELLFCAARNVIEMFWKPPKVPALKDWYIKAWDYFLQDKILVSLLRFDNLPDPDNLQEKWLPLLTATSSKSIDTTLFAD